MRATRTPLLHGAALPLWALAALLGAAAPAFAQSAENVAVVVNEASPASVRIAEHYVRTRGIPAPNVIRIRTAVADQIDRAAYVATIEQPTAAALRDRLLQDRILYLVLTKGVPLRIAGTVARDGTSASVDSELTLLYRRMVGRPVPVAGRVENPYFLGGRRILDAQPFTHERHDIFLVTRLDGFSEDDVVALIDRAQRPETAGRVVLDLRGGLKSSTGDDWLHDAAGRLADLGHGSRVALGERIDATAASEGVIGYYSWGSTDPDNRSRTSGLRFVPGALAAMFLSSDARTFQAPPDQWLPTGNMVDRTTWFAASPQSLAGDLIREGITGVAGNVAEPFLDSAVRPEILFPAYLAGFTLAEAYYLALPHLGWQTVIIGDPLCRPFPRPALTRDAIEAPPDQESGVPGWFARHRLERLQAVYPGAAPRALSLLTVADARLQKEDVAGARQALEEAAAAAPQLAAIHLQLALMYEQTEERALAADRYRQVLKAEPDNVVALNNLAYALAVHDNKPAEALPMARRAAALQPRSPAILDTLAWVEHLNGNTAEGARVFRETLRVGTEDPEIRVRAAIVFAAAGDRAGAKLQLDEALKRDPDLAARDDVKALTAQLPR
jgi:uncharacterized protein (TIGR03790 family)